MLTTLPTEWRWEMTDWVGEAAWWVIRQLRLDDLVEVLPWIGPKEEAFFLVVIGWIIFLFTVVMLFAVGSFTLGRLKRE